MPDSALRQRAAAVLLLLAGCYQCYQCYLQLAAQSVLLPPAVQLQPAAALVCLGAHSTWQLHYCDLLLRLQVQLCWLAARLSLAACPATRSAPAAAQPAPSAPALPPLAQPSAEASHQTSTAYYSPPQHSQLPARTGRAHTAVPQHPPPPPAPAAAAAAPPSPQAQPPLSC